MSSTGSRYGEAVLASGSEVEQRRLRGPGQVEHSKLPELVHQEIWAWLLVHHALSVLAARTAHAAGLDPELLHPRLAHRPPHRHWHGGLAPERWNNVLPDVLASITKKIIPARWDRICPRAIKRARHNSYRVKRPGERSICHTGPPTIHIRALISITT